MSVRSVLTRFALYALTALLIPVAGARADDEVHVSVVSVLATTKNKKVDERALKLAEEMKKIDPTLTGFSVARMTCKDLSIGKKDCFETVDGQDVCITAEARCEKDNKRVRLKVEAPTLGPITYTSTCCNKFFPVVTRYKTKSGDVLILAIRVNACGNK
jgi:hypothetical protein